MFVAARLIERAESTRHVIIISFRGCCRPASRLQHRASNSELDPTPSTGLVMGRSDIGCGDDENIDEISAEFFPHASPKQRVQWRRSRGRGRGRGRSPPVKITGARVSFSRLQNLARHSSTVGLRYQKASKCTDFHVKFQTFSGGIDPNP